MRPIALVVTLLLLVATTMGAAVADDWTAVRLRGTVLQLIDGEWAKLARGDVVPDAQVIRTLSNGRADFERGAETVSLGPNTQIQIFDKDRAKPFTTVRQYFGTVTVDAEVRNVQHFAVQTPYLAAVVKGTRFIVTSDKSGATVTVKRGQVEVDAGRLPSVLLSVGQSASYSTAAAGVAGTLVITGDGKIVVTGNGKSKVVETGNGGIVVTGGAHGASASASAGNNGISLGVGSGNGLALGILKNKLGL